MSKHPVVAGAFALLAFPAHADEAWSERCDEAVEEVVVTGGAPAANPDPARVYARYEVDPAGPAAALVPAVASLRAAGHRCVALPGQARPVALAAVADLPLYDGPAGLAWVEVSPLVVWLDGEAVTVARWPNPGVAVSPADPVLDALLRVERLALPQRRDAVVHVDPVATVTDVAALVGRLQARGFTTVALHAGEAAWRPTSTPAGDPASWRRLPVATAWAVNFSPDGTADIRFPISARRPLHTLAPEDVVGYQEACWEGVCDLVAVTRDERFFVARVGEPPAEDPRRRWLFGVPVLPYEGPGLRGRMPPTVEGELAALPIVRHFREAPAADARLGDLEIVGQVDNSRLLAMLDDREAVFGHCFLEQVDLYRAGLARNPFGVIRFVVDIDATGHVAALEVDESTTVQNRALVACVAEAVRATRFPRSRDGKPVRIRYGHGFGIRD